MDSAPLRESHALAHRDPGGVYVGHMTRDEFFRASPEPGAPCSTATTKCTQRFVYDGADRLIEEDDGHDKVTGYRLEPAGGIREKFDADDPGERVLFRAEFEGMSMVKRTLDPDSADPTQVLLHYDGEGNLDCTTDPGGTRDDCSRSGGDVSPLVVEDFSYDYRNRLTTWERPEANRSTSYEHDALDRPISETETVAGSTSRHELSYVGATRLLAEEQETGARQKTRSYSHDAYGRLNAMSYRSGGGATHELSYAYDPRGSVSMLLDDSGQPKAAYGYTGYGEPDAGLTAERLPDTGQSPDPSEQVNPFRYSAKRSDALSGTIDMGARQFGPGLGQFLQADRYDGALADLSLSTDPLTGNRYSLAGGNPISFVEIDGHDNWGADTQSRGCFACGPKRDTAEETSGYYRGQYQAHQPDVGNHGTIPTDANTGGGYPSSPPTRASSSGPGASAGPGMLGAGGVMPLRPPSQLQSPTIQPLLEPDDLLRQTRDPRTGDVALGALQAGLSAKSRQVQARVPQLWQRMLRYSDPRFSGSSLQRPAERARARALRQHGAAQGKLAQLERLKRFARGLGAVGVAGAAGAEVAGGRDPVESGFRAVGSGVFGAVGAGLAGGACAPAGGVPAAAGCGAAGAFGGGWAGEQVGGVAYDVADFTYQEVFEPFVDVRCDLLPTC